MVRLKMTNCNVVLTEKQQKYEQYQIKLLNRNILQVKK